MLRVRVKDIFNEKVWDILVMHNADKFPEAIPCRQQTSFTASMYIYFFKSVVISVVAGRRPPHEVVV